MTKSKRKKISVFTLLLGNYIVFTLLLVILLLGIYGFISIRTKRNINALDPTQIHNYDTNLRLGQYDIFPTERLLGSDGYIVVLDNTGNSIYSSRSLDKGIHFTDREIACISDYINDPWFEIRPLTNASGEEQTVITIFGYTEDGEENDQEFILDENNHLVYSSIDLGKDNLTTTEYELLSNSYDSDFTILKYRFKSENNLDYTLLLYQAKANNGLLQSKIDRSVNDGILLFIFAYCILIMLFIFWLNHKLKNPLTLICDAMNNFSNTEQKEIHCKGPREFYEICDSFNAMSKRLKESEDQRGKLEQDRQKMLADISHDLKTPITVILGYAKALNDGIIPENEQFQYLKTIEQKSSYLNDLINTFHEYSKLEHPNYSLNLERIDICNYLRDYIAERYNELTLSGFELEIDIPETHLFCEIDYMELQRVFTNILSNSLKHNDRGTTLYISLSQSKLWIRILIGDNGKGIPKELSSSIFDPFVVGEDARTKQGSGLGLSIAYRIVTAHHGQLHLLPNPLKGYPTVFEIMLPILKKGD